jgi:predicted PurR-regulated permease PerM
VNFGQWLGFVSLLLSFYVLWQIRQLLLLVFTAIIFATALNRLVRWLQKFNLRRNYAIATALTIVIIAVTLFFWLIVPPFTEQFQNLLDLLPNVWQQFRAVFVALKEQQDKLDWLPQLPTTFADLIARLQPIFENESLWRNFLSFFSNSFAAILQLLLVAVLTLMMLFDPQPYRRGFLKLFPSFYRRRAQEILDQSELALGNWMGGILINCLFVGILSGIGLWILQIKLVLVHALMAGLLNFIPNIGPASSVIFPIMVALLDAPWKIGAIIFLYFVIQNIESYFLTPTVMAKQVSLLPAVTLMAQIFFARTFGILGLLLALPLTVVAKTWIEEVLFKDILDRWELVSDESRETEIREITEMLPDSALISAESVPEQLPAEE